MDYRRKISNIDQQSSPLPHDYLKMVTAVFTANFADGAKALGKVTGLDYRFKAQGAVYPDEVLLSLSLLSKDPATTTSVHASADYNPLASLPKVEDLLSCCVDALGAAWGQLLNPRNKEMLNRLSENRLSELPESDVPLEWSPIEVEKRKVFLKLDKAHPEIDELAEDWLKKNDPHYAKRQKEDQTNTENLFVTGKKRTH